MRAANFDGVARAYRWLEYAAFGRLLERARFAHLDYLAPCRDILLLGDGDGRALARILAAAPASRILSVDASATMLSLAASRVAATDRARVDFVHADARRIRLEPGSYDAVVTQFFLDCFTPGEVTALASTIAPALRSHAIWLFADFTLPDRGARRLAGRVITTALYAFFRWRANVAARALPPAEREIGRVGLHPIADAQFAGGLVRSVVFQQGGQRSALDLHDGRARGGSPSVEE